MYNFFCLSIKQEHSYIHSGVTDAYVCTITINGYVQFSQLYLFIYLCFCNSVGMPVLWKSISFRLVNVRSSKESAFQRNECIKIQLNPAVVFITYLKNKNVSSFKCKYEIFSSIGIFVFMNAIFSLSIFAKLKKSIMAG